MAAPDAIGAIRAQGGWDEVGHTGAFVPADQVMAVAEREGAFPFLDKRRAIARDDHENIALQFPVYDALYAYCQKRVNGAAP